MDRQQQTRVSSVSCRLINKVEKLRNTRDFQTDNVEKVQVLMIREQKSFIQYAQIPNQFFFYLKTQKFSIKIKIFIKKIIITFHDL